MNKKILLALITTSGVMALSACGHHKDVRPGVDKTHKVVVKASTKEEGSREALKQARHFCKKNGNQMAAVVNENAEYTGSMDEGAYNAGKKLSKAAQVLGGGLWTTSDGEKGEKAGEVTGMSGTAVDVALGEEYKVEMNFVCK